MGTDVKTLDTLLAAASEIKLKHAIEGAFHVLTDTLTAIRPVCHGFGSDNGKFAGSINCDLCFKSDDAKTQHKGLDLDNVLDEVKDRLIAEWTGPAQSQAVEQFIKRVDELGAQVADLKATVNQ